MPSISASALARRSTSCAALRRLDRFRESDILRYVFERVVAGCMVNGLVKGEGFAVDASAMEANASRYRGKAPDELDWTNAQRQKRAVAEYLAALEAEAGSQDETERGDGDGSDGGRERLTSSIVWSTLSCRRCISLAIRTRS
jgi:hypothetical protein